jgi:hypothetical protein
MHENGKMRLVETILRMVGREKKRRKMEGVNSSIIYCRNFCKFTMYPQYSNMEIRIR